ncbi:MAG: hypothetical protein HYU57_04385 [Micavibrio aeruginosavorus]|nr:hypothetical protein [Micavibrio aeruginosavorus]
MSQPLTYLMIFSAALLGCATVSIPASTARAEPSISGKYCVTAGKGLQLLAARPNEDKTLDFGLSVWFDSGMHCGVTGKATPTEKGWHYQSGLDSPDPDEHCKIDIAVKDSVIVANADTTARCASACGGGGRIFDIAFPPESRESTSLAEDALTPDVLFNTACKNSPSP